MLGLPFNHKHVLFQRFASHVFTKVSMKKLVFFIQ